MTSSSSARRMEEALGRIPPGTPMVAVVGPTAGGKSDWGIAVARALDGEVVSADSRQVFKNLDIGTGKVEGVLEASRGRSVEVLGGGFEVAPFVSEGIDHWLLDLTTADVVVTAAQYQALAYEVIADIAGRGRLPVLVGGTGLYVHAVVDGLVMPSVEPDPALRQRLEGLSAEALRAELLAVDPEAGRVVDLHNPRRMVRAIEVALGAGSVENARGRMAVPFRTLMMGPRIERAALLERIHRRLVARLEQGMIDEVQRLADRGLSHERLDDLGLEYRWVSRYLRGLLTREEMQDELERAIARFARRQMTWFRKRGPVTWLDTVEEAVELARRFVAEGRVGAP